MKTRRAGHDIVACDTCDVLGEGPIWDPRVRRLVWLDIERAMVHTVDPDHGDAETQQVTDGITALGLRASGGYVVAARTGLGFWDRGAAEAEVVEHPERDRVDGRFNDGAVDPWGRFWAGSAGPGSSSALYRMDPDRSVTRIRTGVTVSNGIDWSPDARTMYFTDSRRHIVTAFDLDPSDGTIVGERVFVSTEGEPGVPDGLTVDDEGCVWSVRWGGAAVYRYDPVGRLDRVIPLPVRYPTSCAFGGTMLDLLFVTSASAPYVPEDRSQQPLAGALLCVQPDAHGQQLNSFAG